MIKPSKIPFKQIREEAEKFRSSLGFSTEVLPFPIDKVIDTVMRFEIRAIKNLRSDLDIESFIMSDLTTIMVDWDLYMVNNLENRLNYTFAHELGHYILHPDEIKSCKFRNKDSWKNLRSEVSSEDFMWFELQAYEFGGRLLVPKEKLIAELEEQENNIQKFINGVNGFFDQEYLITRFSGVICDKFGVSSQVIKKRIYKERLADEYFVEK